MLAELHWLRPAVLWALPLVPLCYLWLKRIQQQDGWRQMLAPHLYEHLLQAQQQRVGVRWLWPLLLLLGIVAGAGPSWQKIPQPAFSLKRATVVVMDMSMSMRATDVKPNRLSLARFKALDYLKAQAEGEMALLAFAGDAYVISPLTPDHNNLALLLPDLKPEIMPFQGSNLQSALQLADQLLKQAGYQRGDIVLFTDGIASSDYTQTKDAAQSLPHRISILAFGSARGAPIQLENGELLKDNNGSIVVPKVALDELKDIAHSTGGIFANSGVDDQDIKALTSLGPLDLSDKNQQSRMQGEQWQDGGHYVVMLLMVILLLGYRRQQLLSVLLICYLPLHSTKSSAMDFNWQDLWQSRDEQATEAYVNGDYQQALEKYSTPLWQGNAAYRQQDYAKAAELFQKDSSAQSQFNLGNSLAMQQQYQAALDAYQRASAQNPDLSGLSKNTELVKKLLEQQQQQKQSQQNQQGEPSNEQQNQQKDGKDGQQDQQQQSDQQKQSSEQSDAQNGAEQTADQGADQPKTNDPQQAQTLEQQKEQQAAAEQAEQQKAIAQAWPNASKEELQQLENLLRKVQDDPSLLLKNKMLLEYQKRRQQALPMGATQQW